MEKCPICGHLEVTDKCPRCGTDLTNWGRLSELPYAYFNRAVNFINEGKLHQAKESLFTVIGLYPNNVEALILLGKVNAEMGTYDEAITYWERAKKLDESKSKLLNDNISKAQSFMKKKAPEEDNIFAFLKTEKRAIKRWILLVLVVMVILIVGTTIFYSKIIDTKVDYIREIVKKQEGDKTFINQKEFQINIPGVIIKSVGKQQILMFEDGLFSSGLDSINPKGLEVLNSMARNLQSRVDKNILILEGHTDNQPILRTLRWQNNYELGMYRAFQVANYLISKHNFPRDMFFICSAGELQPPFPNDTKENREKNRTVTIKILQTNNTESK